MPSPLQTGTLLIASQDLQDNYFSRCVIIITQYSPEIGTMGLVINRPIPQTFQQTKITKIRSSFGSVSTEIEIENLIFEGGPVDQDYFLYLHRLNHVIPNGKLISNDLYLGGIAGEEISLNSDPDFENRICFYRGYARWSENQLEQEIFSGTWILAPCDTDSILALNPERMWHDLLYELGGNYRAMAEIPEDPNVN